MEAFGGLESVDLGAFPAGFCGFFGVTLLGGVMCFNSKGNSNIKEENSGRG